MSVVVLSGDPLRPASLGSAIAMRILNWALVDCSRFVLPAKPVIERYGRWRYQFLSAIPDSLWSSNAWHLPLNRLQRFCGSLGARPEVLG